MKIVSGRGSIGDSPSACLADVKDVKVLSLDERFANANSTLLNPASSSLLQNWERSQFCESVVTLRPGSRVRAMKCKFHSQKQNNHFWPKTIPGLILSFLALAL